METGKLSLYDLAPRIKDLKAKQDHLSEVRLQVEAEIVVEQVQPVDVEIVKSYAQNLSSLLEEAEVSEPKNFVKSFIKRIDIEGNQIVVSYSLPMPPDGNSREGIKVPSFVTLSGEGGTRTPTPEGT